MQRGSYKRPKIKNNKNKQINKQIHHRLCILVNIALFWAAI